MNDPRVSTHTKLVSYVSCDQSGVYTHQINTLVWILRLNKPQHPIPWNDFFFSHFFILVNWTSHDLQIIDHPDLTPVRSVIGSTQIGQQRFFSSFCC